jgi:hypothetical protein
LEEYHRKRNPQECTAPPPPPPAPGPVPKLEKIIGRAVPRIGAYQNLDNKQQVVALVDEELCINCGKCCICPCPAPFLFFFFSLHFARFVGCTSGSLTGET